MTRKSLVSQLCGLLALTCAACVRFGSQPIDAPNLIVFDATREQIEGGIHLAPADSRWDGYGEAIDVHGDVMVIGASEWNQCGSGSAYVYRRQDGAWQEEARLTASDRDAFIERAARFEGQRFGSSVAVSAGVVAIGAPGNAYLSGSGYAGGAYVYERVGLTWEETAILVPRGSEHEPGQEPLDPAICSRLRPRSYGALVALDGETLAVGGDAGGLVYLYQRGADDWEEQARIAIPGQPGKELYTTSMTLFGDILALSVFYQQPGPEQDPVLTGAVMVYVFERAGGIWNEVYRLDPGGKDENLVFFRELNFGAAVALGGKSGQADLLAVGLAGFPDWSDVEDYAFLFGTTPEQVPEFPVAHHQAGAVYLLERAQDGEWVHRTTLRPAGWEDPPGPGTVFSNMPSHLDDEPGGGLEASFFDTYVFPGHIYSESPEISFFGATLDLDDNRLAVTAGFANATYVFERRGQEWLYRFSLEPDREKEELWEDMAQIVVISGDTLLLGTPGEFGNSAYVFQLSPSTEG